MIAYLIFVICGLALAYVFLLYPLAVILLGSRRREPSQPRWLDAQAGPTVTVILAAYNEERHLSEKLSNTMRQDYPAGKLDIIVVDDGSTDYTVEIVRQFQDNRVQLLQQERRLGKTAALNRAVREAKGEVLVFTDANALFQADAVQHLVNSFDAEGNVGVVCGELKYQLHPQTAGADEGYYWDLEIQLKRAESQLGTLLGANGSIYALRRELYIPLHEDVISDFIEPLLLARKGYRTIYQPQAISYESSSRNLKAEFRRKKRIVQRGLYGLWAHSELLSPIASGWLAVQLWSHKALRWLTPLWGLGLLLGSWGLQQQPFFFWLLWVQVCGYGICLTSLLLQMVGKPMKLLRLPAYAAMLLAATLSAWWGFLRGQKVVVWEPQR